jgi:hypothetical protein
VLNHVRGDGQSCGGTLTSLESGVRAPQPSPRARARIGSTFAPRQRLREHLARAQPLNREWIFCLRTCSDRMRMSPVCPQVCMASILCGAPPREGGARDRFSSPSELNTITEPDLRQRVDIAVARRNDTRLPDDRLAPFITLGVLDRLDNYIRELTSTDNDLRYQRLVARVVADVTGAGALPLDADTEKLGNRIAQKLLQTYSRHTSPPSARRGPTQRGRRATAACWRWPRSATLTATA